MSYASLNQYVFSSFLNLSISLINLKLLGIEFHSISAATLNEQTVNVLHLVLGIGNLVVEPEQRPSGRLQMTIRSFKYSGASPLRHL